MAKTIQYVLVRICTVSGMSETVMLQSQNIFNKSCKNFFMLKMHG
jgi:hypothetical protein